MCLYVYIHVKNPTKDGRGVEDVRFQYRLLEVHPAV
jgi:hypothetical protein